MSQAAILLDKTKCSLEIFEMNASITLQIFVQSLLLLSFLLSIQIPQTLVKEQYMMCGDKNVIYFSCMT